MAVEALAGRGVGIVHPAAAGKGSGRMAEIAVHQDGWFNMGRDGVDLACCRHAVMAVDATVDDAGVIEGRRFEEARVMADTAILIGRDMSGFLRRCKTSIVTGTTVIHYACVTEGGRRKTGGLVAVDAIAIGRHMEIGFSGSGGAVVTGDTVIGYVLVTKRGLSKLRGHMAHRAIL